MQKVQTSVSVVVTEKTPEMKVTKDNPLYAFVGSNDGNSTYSKKLMQTVHVRHPSGNRIANFTQLTLKSRSLLKK